MKITDYFGQIISGIVGYHKGIIGFRPLVVENDELVGWKKSIHLLRLQNKEEEKVIRSNQVWKLRVISAVILKGKTDKNGLPMVEVKVALISQSFLRNGKWVTVNPRGDIITSTSAIRMEITDLESSPPVLVEQIMADGVIVRRRVVKEPPRFSVYIYKRKEWVTFEAWAGEKTEIDAKAATSEKTVYSITAEEVAVVERIVLTDGTIVRERLQKTDTLLAYRAWLCERAKTEDEWQSARMHIPPILPDSLWHLVINTKDCY